MFFKDRIITFGASQCKSYTKCPDQKSNKKATKGKTSSAMNRLGEEEYLRYR